MREATVEDMARVRALIGSAATYTGGLDIGDLLAIAERIDELRRNPIQALEVRIATATLDDLEDIQQTIDAIGVRMMEVGGKLVERAAELRAVLAKEK